LKDRGGEHDPTQPDRWTKALREWEDVKRGRTPEAKADLLDRTKASQRREQQRTKELVAREVAERRREIRRVEAEIEVEAGKSISLDDSKLGPTPEQQAKGEFANFDIPAPMQTANVHSTVRNLTASRILQLHHRGVLSDIQYGVCAWYREQWERGGLSANPKISSYAPFADPGEPVFGHLPRTTQALEARSMFGWLRELVDIKMLPVLDAVVLEELSIEDMARKLSFRRVTAAKRFREVASDLALRACAETWARRAVLRFM